jgi:hypothetical protein
MKLRSAAAMAFLMPALAGVDEADFSLVDQHKKGHID